MADNYLQFSLSIPLTTKKAADWFTAVLSDLDGTKVPVSPSPLARRFLDEGWDYVSFEWSLRDGALWLYAEEAGDPDQVAAVLEEYLKLFAPKGVITFTWACTCSKMRVDEFAGGAAVIRAHGTTFLNVGDWAAEQAAAVTSHP